MRPRRRCSCNRQRVPRRRARVGGLCGFPDTAERVPAGSHKTGRCAAVRKCCKNEIGGKNVYGILLRRISNRAKRQAGADTQGSAGSLPGR